VLLIPYDLRIFEVVPQEERVQRREEAENRVPVVQKDGVDQHEALNERPSVVSMVLA
jgi:hypothetical protein